MDRINELGLSENMVTGFLCCDETEVPEKVLIDDDIQESINLCLEKDSSLLGIKEKTAGKFPKFVRSAHKEGLKIQLWS